MEQTGQYIFEFLRQWGYWGMLPLMIIEGPVVTIISALLAALGAFNVFVVLAFSIAGDMIGDIILYGLGYKFGMGFVRGFGKYMGITESLVNRMQKYFEKHGGKTIFLVKSTTGLCWATFTAAGIVKMDFKKFVKYSFFGGVVWSSFLVLTGYFYGYLWAQIKHYISWIGWLIFVAALITFVVITIYKRHQARKILRENDK
jgi:membrane protein DedA with SNARE-associated domain